MKNKIYNLHDAINLLKNEKFAYFKKTIESIDIAINFDINKKNKFKYKKLEGSIILPYNKNSIKNPMIKEKIYFKLCKDGIIHSPIGKVNFTKKMLIDNIKSFINHIKKLKPSSLKGKYIKKITISRTMGKSFCLILNSI